MSDTHPIPAAGAAPGSRLDAAQKLKLQKAVREFESIFVGYMLKSMRNTVEKADNTTDGFGTDILEGMFDVELARHISRSSNLGMAEMLYRRMTGESLPRHAAVRTGAETKPLRATERDNPRAAHAGWNAEALQERLRRFDEHISEAAEKFGVRDSLIRAVIAAESGARADARSAKDAKGLMQLLDSTAAAMGVRNVWDPRQNILGGTKYLKELLERFGGDETLALASYNAGPAAVERHGGVPPYRETRDYIARVMSFVQMLEHQEDDHDER